MAYLWEWFSELDEGRSGSGFGPNPLSWTEIDAWARRTRCDPLPWELSVIRALDQAYLVSFAEAQKK